MPTDRKGNEIHADWNEVDDTVFKEFHGENPAEVIYTADAESRAHRSRQQRDWTTSLSMLGGDQWLRWSPRSDTVQRFQDLLDPKRPDIVRAVDNRLLPAFDQKHSRMIGVKHVPEVVPAPGRGDQRDNAEMQTQYLQSLWLVQKLRVEDVRLKAWVVALGLAWLKVVWDFDAGLPSFKCKNPFEVNVVPYGVISADYAEAMIETAAVAVEILKQKHPKALADWDRTGQTELREELNTVLASSDSFLQFQGRSRQIKGMVAVREVYRRPCEKHPKGYKALVTRKRVLELKPLADPGLWPPYFQFRFREFPGALYPPGLIAPVISDQVLLNKARSDIYGYLHRKCHARRLIRSSADLSIEAFDDLGTDLIWEDDPDLGDAEPVQWDVPPPLNIEYWRIYDDMKQSMDDALQLHDPGRGRPGSNVQSGKQVELLQAQDETHVTPALELIGEAWEAAYTRALVLTARKQRKPINLAGVDPRTASPFSVQDFMLNKDNEASFLVRVRTVSQTPYDKIIALENNRMLLESQVLQQVMPPDRIVKAFEQGQDASLYDTDNGDRIEARAENKRILSGQLDARVEFWHNNAVHIEEHLKECRSLRFGEAPIEIREWMGGHVRLHIQKQMMEQEGEVAMEQPEQQGVG